MAVPRGLFGASRLALEFLDNPGKWANPHPQYRDAVRRVLRRALNRAGSDDA